MRNTSIRVSWKCLLEFALLQVPIDVCILALTCPNKQTTRTRISLCFVEAGAVVEVEEVDLEAAAAAVEAVEEEEAEEGTEHYSLRAWMVLHYVFAKY